MSTTPALSTSHEKSPRGVVCATSAYLIWGVVPLFWKQLAAVDAGELIAHRIVWALACLLPVVWWRGRLRDLRSALLSPAEVARSLLSASLLTVNWWIYVWGVNAGHVVECSLGYFLQPLLNVTLARLVLHEQLRRIQGVAVLIAAAGVALMIARLGHVPWIAFGIAGSFAFYGLLRKRSALGSLRGLAVETCLLLPFAGGWLIWLASHGKGALGHMDTRTTLLILSTGALTATPLLLWADAARRLTFTTLGVLQYLAPTCQFLLGVLVYREPLPPERLQAFALIWLALVIFSAEGVWASRRQAGAR